MSAGTWPVAAWLSFRRIVEIPFETCVAALENWQRRRQDGELHIGPSRLRGPIVHDRDSGTCRIEVHLARGPLRPPLRMRLEIERWSRAPARTALELIPCQRVRPTTTYFGAGHLLLDSLTDSLRNTCPRTALTTSRQATHAHRDNPGPGASLEVFDFLQQCPLPQRPEPPSDTPRAHAQALPSAGVRWAHRSILRLRRCPIC